MPKRRELGRRAPSEIADRPKLKLGPVLRTIEDVKPRVDWHSAVSDWPMYMNDWIGDCTCATAAHMIQSITTYGQGETFTPSDHEVLKAYIAISGYDPETGANDNGAYVQDLMDYWRKEGFSGHRIMAFAQVDFRDIDEVRKACQIFGGIYLGIAFPESAYDQLDAGQAWDVVPGSRLLGGHAINSGWYDIEEDKWKVITWGEEVEMTQEFWDEYVDEAWVVITPEWFKDNKNPEGLDLYALGEHFSELTGEPNPFPTPAVPEPEGDELFAEAARVWLVNHPRYYKPFQQALIKWLDEKGL